MFVSRRKRDERGAAAVMFALLSVILLGVAALGTDVGNMVSRRTMSQTQADFAALAASHELHHTPRVGETPSTAAVNMVRDYLNHNQPQDDERDCWRNTPVDCVTSAHLTDGGLANGEVRMTSEGMEVVAPQSRVDFGLAGIFGASGTYVDASATVTVKSGGVRVMPMFAVSGCDYGRQTLTDPASGHAPPGGAPSISPSDSNPNLDNATLKNSTGSTVTELAKGSTSNIIALQGTSWDKSRKIGFFLEGSTTPIEQGTFWAPGDATRTDLSPDTKPAGMSDSDYAKLYRASSATVEAMIPDTVAQTEGIWWVRVFNGTDAAGKWSSSAVPIRVGGAVLECAAGSTQGNFGTLKLPRTDVATALDLPVNIALGLQEPLTPTIHEWAVANPTLAGTCTNGFDGAVESSGDTLLAGTNCVDTDTGLAANVATQGMITGAGTAPGMLTTQTTRPGCGMSDRTKVISGRSYTFNNDILTCYLTDTTTSLATISSSTYSGPPVLDDDIYSAPRFVWVPVLADPPSSGGSNRYSLIDFRPAFITDELSSTAATKGSHTATSDNGLTIPSNDITQIKVVFFDIDALPTDGDFPTIDFLGVGKPIVRLVD
ncbi:MAG TPA: TadE/TadG family type IV pilus assembly protein [Nocardioides sp.]|nr:TadE/TadG family type IV pilus assembly protein [Nocardioides sp.]